MGGVGQPAGGGVGSPAWRLHDGGHSGRGEEAKDLRGEVRRRGRVRGEGGEGRGGEKEEIGGCEGGREGGGGGRGECESV